MDIKKFVLSYYANATEELHVNEVTNPRESLSLHRHAYYQIYYLKSGRLIHHLESGSAELKASDVFIIPPDLPHFIEPVSKEVRFYSISFMPGYIAEIVRSNKLVADFIHCITDLASGGVQPGLTLRAEDLSLADALVLKIMEEFSSDQMGKDAVITFSLSLLLSLFARAYLGEHLEDVRFISEREAILHSLGYIKNHLGERITLGDTARRAAMARSTFCESFRKVTGETFHGYLNRERVEAAAALIKSGKLVFEAAMEVGYNDPSTFYRNFKKHFGVSPGEYK